MLDTAKGAAGAKTTTGDDQALFHTMIAEYCTESIVITDADGLTLWANEAFQRLSGYPAKALIGRKPGDLLQGPDTDPATVAEVHEALRDKRPCRVDILNYSADGHPYWIDMSVAPVFDAEGRHTHFISVERDITDRVELQARMERSLARDKARRRERRLLSLMSGWLFAAQSMPEIQAIVQRSMVRLLPRSAGALYIYSNSRDLLDLACHWGPQPGVDHLRADECWALRRGRAHFFGANEIDFPCAHVGEDGHTHPEGDPYFCMPVIAHGDTIGMMHVTFAGAVAEDAAPDEIRTALASEWDLAKLCAEQISLAIAKVQLQTTLLDRSVTDHLTQLWNRRGFLDLAERELRRAEGVDEPCAVAILDVDHFKRFNDTYGHDAGDAVLREVGGVLDDSTSDGVHAGRIGGEEFGILCVGHDAAAAQALLERIRARIGRVRVHVGDRDLPAITISAGIAERGAGGNLPDMLGRADRALYEAKKAGRNRVLVADPA